MSDTRLCTWVAPRRQESKNLQAVVRLYFFTSTVHTLCRADTCSVECRYTILSHKNHTQHDNQRCFNFQGIKA